MYGREELDINKLVYATDIDTMLVDCEGTEVWPQDSDGCEYYFKSQADKVMDAMETRIKELEEKYKRLIGENQGNFDAMSIAIDGWEKRECELLERIAELESQLPKWISVKDKLPEKYGPYLVIHEDCKGGNAMDVFYYLLDETEGPVLVYDYQEVTSVTHWMPLPPTTEES